MNSGNILTMAQKKKTQHVQVRCLVIEFDHNVKLAGQFQNLDGHFLMTKAQGKR